MEKLTFAAQIASSATTIAAAVILLVKPLRDRILGMKKVQDGQKCILRGNMLHTYYKQRESGTIRQYEYENFLYEYQAYKALQGNSFIDKIKAEVDTWDVLS